MYTICVLSGAHVILLIAIIIVAYLMINRNSVNQKSRNEATNSTNVEVINEQGPPPQPTLHIPDTCPFCKRPNTRRTRLCEWCGEQIC